MKQKNSMKLEKLQKRNQKKDKIGLTKIPFECPHCHWILRSEKPDDKHPNPSVKKPRKNIVKSDILTKELICRNPRCKKEIIVFWFEPKDFSLKI